MAKDDKKDDAGRNEVPTEKLTTSDADTAKGKAAEESKAPAKDTAKATDKSDKAKETDKADKSSPTEKADKAEKSDEGAKAEKSDEGAKAETAKEKNAKAAEKAEKKKAKKAAKAEDPDSGKRRIGYGWPIAAAVVGVIGLVLATVFFLRPGLDYENEAFADRETTDEVATAAAENAKKLVGIDYETLDEYVDGLPEIMTPELEDELMQSWDQLADTYEQAKTKVDVSISDVGVTYLEENRAEVLIAQNVSVTQDGQAAGSTDGTYLVRLEKVDGDWKLSSIPDLPS